MLYILRLFLTLCQPFLVFDDLHSFKECLVSYFVKCPFMWACLIFFFMIRMGWWVLEEDHGVCKISFLSHHIKGSYYQYDLSVMMLTLITRLRWYCQVLHCKVTLPSFTYCILRKGATMLSLPLGEGYILCNLFEFFYMGDLSLLSHFLIYSIIYFYLYGIWIMGYSWNIKFTNLEVKKQRSKNEAEKGQGVKEHYPHLSGC